MKKQNETFDHWNEKKKLLHRSHNKKLFKSREIWWCSIGANVSYEEDGKHDNFERPVLILKSYGSELFFAAMLTSKAKNNIFHHELRENSYVILSQLKTLSSKRLIRKITRLRDNKFNQVQKAIQDLNFK